jgi:hypothetical protein
MRDWILVVRIKNQPLTNAALTNAYQSVGARQCSLRLHSFEPKSQASNVTGWAGLNIL